MTLVELQETLARLRRKLEVDGSFPGILPAHWEKAADLYYAAQEKALKSIGEAGKSVLGKGLLPDRGVLLVRGSISRLEFAPGTSDVDCLAILDQVGANSTAFKDFKKELRTSIGLNLRRAERKLRGEFSPKKVPKRKKRRIKIDVGGVSRTLRPLING